jgi:hypothetical protein
MWSHRAQLCAHPALLNSLSFCASIMHDIAVCLRPFSRRPLSGPGLYRYRFTTPAKRRQTGAWWARELVGEYLPPVRLDLVSGRAGHR